MTFKQEEHIQYGYMYGSVDKWEGSLKTDKFVSLVDLISELSLPMLKLIVTTGMWQKLDFNKIKAKYGANLLLLSAKISGLNNLICLYETPK